MKKAFFLCLVIWILILAACKPQPDELPSGVKKVVRSGNFVERYETVKYPINNCDGQEAITLSQSYAKSLSESVQISGDVEFSGTFKNVIEGSIGAQYGVTNTATITHSAAITISADPGKFPIREVKWKEYWEKGYVVIASTEGERQVEYQFLTNAEYEVVAQTYIECSSNGYATATAIVDQPISALQPVQIPIATTPIANQRPYRDYNFDALDVTEFINFADSEKRLIESASYPDTQQDRHGFHFQKKPFNFVLSMLYESKPFLRNDEARWLDVYFGWLDKDRDGSADQYFRLFFPISDQEVSGIDPLNYSYQLYGDSPYTDFNEKWPKQGFDAVGRNEILVYVWEGRGAVVVNGRVLNENLDTGRSDWEGEIVLERFVSLEGTLAVEEGTTLLNIEEVKLYSLP